MCGIAGQIGRDPRVIQGQYAAYCAMQQTLSRRGPDQRGMFISGRAALIHARLAGRDAAGAARRPAGEGARPAPR